jgi:hypothetical protein
MNNKTKEWFRINVPNEKIPDIKPTLTPVVVVVPDGTTNN